VARFRHEGAPEQRLAMLETFLAQTTDDLTKAVPPPANLLSIPIGERYEPLELAERTEERWPSAEM
jgi:hypothetical protein